MSSKAYDVTLPHYKYLRHPESFIISYLHSPSTIQFCHDSLAYIYSASLSNDVNVLLSSDGRSNRKIIESADERY